MPNLDGYDEWDTYVNPSVHALSDNDYAALELAESTGDLYPEDDAE